MYAGNADTTHPCLVNKNAILVQIQVANIRVWRIRSLSIDWHKSMTSFVWLGKLSAYNTDSFGTSPCFPVFLLAGTSNLKYIIPRKVYLR